MLMAVKSLQLKTNSWWND